MHNVSFRSMDSASVSRVLLRGSGIRLYRSHHLPEVARYGLELLMGRRDLSLDAKSAAILAASNLLNVSVRPGGAR